MTSQHSEVVSEFGDRLVEQLLHRNPLRQLAMRAQNRGEPPQPLLLSRVKPVKAVLSGSQLLQGRPGTPAAVASCLGQENERIGASRAERRRERPEQCLLIERIGDGAEIGKGIADLFL